MVAEIVDSSAILLLIGHCSIIVRCERGRLGRTKLGKLTKIISLDFYKHFHLKVCRKSTEQWFFLRLRMIILLYWKVWFCENLFRAARLRSGALLATLIEIVRKIVGLVLKVILNQAFSFEERFSPLESALWQRFSILIILVQRASIVERNVSLRQTPPLGFSG